MIVKPWDRRLAFATIKTVSRLYIHGILKDEQLESAWLVTGDLEHNFVAMTELTCTFLQNKYAISLFPCISVIHIKYQLIHLYDTAQSKALKVLIIIYWCTELIVGHGFPPSNT